jgi:hypothetical protein
MLISRATWPSQSPSNKLPISFRGEERSAERTLLSRIVLIREAQCNSGCFIDLFFLSKFAKWVEGIDEVRLQLDFLLNHDKMNPN